MPESVRNAPGGVHAGVFVFFAYKLLVAIENLESTESVPQELGLEVLDSPCTRTVNARVPRRIQHDVLSVNSARMISTYLYPPEDRAAAIASQDHTGQYGAYDLPRSKSLTDR